MRKTFSLILCIIVILTSLANMGAVSGERTLEVEGRAQIFINLKAARFDPLLEAPSIPEELSYTDENNYYLVQCKGPIQQEWIETILDSGAVILGYIPEYTYILYMEKDVKKGLEHLPFIRWTGIYHPAYKIEENLLPKQGQVQLNAVVFQEKNGLDNLKLVRDKITALGGSIVYDGNDNFVIQAEIDASRIKDMAFIPEVEWIDEYTPPKKLMDNIRVFTGAESPLHDHGLNGTGIVGEVKDGGIDLDHPEFEGQLIGTDGSITEDSHGTSTFGIVFAKGISDRAMGMMPDGKGVFCDWGVGRVASIQHLVNNWGGVFQSNSWSQGSSNGEYSSYSQQNDQAVFQYDVSMLYAAGNGDTEITQEAAAKNVIAVGGVYHYDDVDRTNDAHNGAGSHGPASDGRIKPDLCGPYDSIYTTTSDDGYTSSFGGTSGATPVVAGGAGLVYQMYRENIFGNNPSGALPHASTVKAILIADAYQYEFSQADRFEQGWGLVDVGNVYNIGESHFIDDENNALQTGYNNSYKITPTTSTPLKMSLVWTDVPGTTSSSMHLINDLNLRVTDPNGVVYYGNFGLNSSKWSYPGGEIDHTNNVENVFIENPISGEWTIEVKGENVPMDGVPGTPETDQNYALVASGVSKFQHDLRVQSLYYPKFVDVGEIVPVNAIIMNIGYQDEADVKVEFSVDDNLVDTTNINFIGIGEMVEANFLWTAAEARMYNITVFVEPVGVEETSTEDNRMEVVIDASAVVGRVLVDDGHDTDWRHHVYYYYIEAMGPEKYRVFHTSQTITAELLADFDVFITARPTQSYTTEEEASIQSFVEDGGGLLVIGEDEGDIYNGLTSYAGIEWGSPFSVLFVGETEEINQHEITENVNSLYFGSHQLPLMVNAPAEEIAYTYGGVLYDRVVVAAAEYGLGKLVAIADEECLNSEFIFEADNIIFGENIIRWLNNEAPRCIIDSPQDDSSYLPTETIYFDGSSSYDPDGSIVDYIWTSDIDGTIGTAVTFSAQLSEGVHTITLSVTDNGGKTSTAIVTITVAAGFPPDIIIEYPNDGEIVSGVVTVSGSASDSDGSVEAVFVRIGGGDWDQAVGTENWDYDWDTTYFTDGDWTVQAHAIDDEGLLSEISSITVRVDNSPPMITYGPTASSITGTQATIEWETDEPGDSLVEYGISTSYGYLESEASFVTHHSIVLTDLSPSTVYHFRVKSSDMTGNGPTVSEDGTFTTASPIPPTASIESPSDGEIVNGFVTVSGSAFDIDGFVEYVEVRLGTGGWAQANGAESWDYEWDTTSYPDGEITIRVRSIDNDDQYSEINSTTVTIDNNLAPVAMIDSPSDGSTFTSAYSIQFNGSSSYDPDGSIVEHIWTSDIDGTIGNDAVFTTQLSVGVHEITLAVTDNGGKTSFDSITLNINVPVLPEIRIDSPSSGDIVKGIITITGKASDGDGSVERVEVRVGSGYWAQAEGTENWYYDWDTTSFSDGGYKIQARSIDNEDQHSDTDSITVSVDNTPPEADIASPEDGGTVKGEVEVTAEAYDDYGIAEVEFYIDEELKFTDGDPDYSWFWDTTSGPYPDGQYSIKIMVRDLIGNEKGDEIVVTVDNVAVAPTIVDERATPNTVTNDEWTEVLFTVEVSDPEDNVEEVVIDLSPIGDSSDQYMYDDGSHGDEIAGDNVYSFKTAVPSDTLAGEKSMSVTIIYGEGESIATSIALYISQGQVDDGSEDEGYMSLLLLLVISVIAAGILGLIFAAVKRRRPKNKAQVVAPLYQYYK